MLTEKYFEMLKKRGKEKKGGNKGITIIVWYINIDIKIPTGKNNTSY